MTAEKIPSTVLLVDDDPLQAVLVETVLAVASSLRLAAHVTTVAAARTWLEHNAADVVLLDHDLPDGTAADLTAWMRNLGRQVPVLLSTGRDDAEELALDIGADGGVRKDTDWVVVLRRLEQLACRRPAPFSDEALLSWAPKLVQDAEVLTAAVHECTTLALDGPDEDEARDAWLVRIASIAAELDAALVAHRALLQAAVRMHLAYGAS